MTIALAIACGALAVLAGVLGVLLLRPRAKSPAPPPPRLDAEPWTPAVEVLARDLQDALAEYRTQPAVPVPAAARTVRRTPPPAAARPTSSAAATGRGKEHRRAHARHQPRADVRTPSRASLASNSELGELLTQALSTARAIPGADAAAVALPAWREPVIGTLGLARHEASRLASTLPAAGAHTRSIAIEYEYGPESALEERLRLRHGIAVPVPGLPTPGLIAILARSPATRLGQPEVELLEEVVERLAPALARVLEWDAATAPAAITVRAEAEADARLRGRAGASAQREEGQELRQVDRLHDR